MVQARCLCGARSICYYEQSKRGEGYKGLKGYKLVVKLLVSDLSGLDLCTNY